MNARPDPATDPMLSFDLGPWRFPITTRGAAAQRYFDQGLNWSYAFNPEEAIACYKRALAHDPSCAMAHWGVAYAAGPYYNMPWEDFSPFEAIETTALCRAHIEAALSYARDATPLEQALINALDQRVQADHVVPLSTFSAWDDAYADAMREVYTKFPDNADVAALLVEALMMRTPWRMWDITKDAPPPGADTFEAVAICERAIDMAEQNGAPQHPAILHLHIHLWEMSEQPEAALGSARKLAALSPDGGHMHHMPAHIFVLLGEYAQAASTSDGAIEADRKYLAYAGRDNAYTTARCHDLHLKMYACLMMGQFQPAWDAANEITENLSPQVLANVDKPYVAATMEGYAAMHIHVLMRFGRWDEIIAWPLPDDPELYLLSTAITHYAKAIAHAALTDFDQAELHRSLFYKACKPIPWHRKLFNNSVLGLLDVAASFMEGEVAYHQGKHETAFDHLRESVRRSDILRYAEPWPWMHPPRHALGALLAEQGQFEEAEAVYRTDLGLDDRLPRCAQNRNNVWALHGLVECLKQRQETEELSQLTTALSAAQELADGSVTSSCACRMSPK